MFGSASTSFKSNFASFKSRGDKMDGLDGYGFGS